MAKGWIGMRRSCRLRRRTATAECCRHRALGTAVRFGGFLRQRNQRFQEKTMGKGILLWLIGIPLPIIILLLLFWR
jgi:hypothetical protein